MKYGLLIGCWIFMGCGHSAETGINIEVATPPVLSDSSDVDKYYHLKKGNGLKSISRGTVSNGSLENGKLMTFSGPNFRYFDKTSYLAGRAFLHEKVKQTASDAYTALYHQLPGRKFFIMECSNENGGEMFPHRTHRNGLSIDFMMPLTKSGKPYYGLDTIGKAHYWLNFDNHGRYYADTSVAIDYSLVAQHLLLLEKYARKNGLRLSKVIIKTELKDELFSSPNGRKLKSGGIYIVKNLPPLINALHDEHYHVDFEVIN